MRGAAALAAIAGLLLNAAPLAAQQAPVRIAPEDARLCAIWASYLSGELVDDPDSQQALMMATNYFVGHFEGATGRSIAQGEDRAAAEQVVLNLEATTQVCTAHMQAYSERMGQWGALLEQLGEVGAQ
jgi:hypothetical protein